MRLDLHQPIQWLRWISSNVKRLTVLVGGVALLGAGLAMVVLPGPGILVVVAGLAVLATEFAWAERALDRTRSTATTATTKLATNRTGRTMLALSASALIVGGATVVAVGDGHRWLGVATLVSGLGAFAVLFPTVRRWIDRSNARAASPADPNSDDDARLLSRAPSRPIRPERSMRENVSMSQHSATPDAAPVAR